MKKNLIGMNKEDLELFFLSLGEKSFRSKQVYQWIHQKGVSDFKSKTMIIYDFMPMKDFKRFIKNSFLTPLIFCLFKLVLFLVFSSNSYVCFDDNNIENDINEINYNSEFDIIGNTLNIIDFNI